MQLCLHTAIYVQNSPYNCFLEKQQVNPCKKTICFSEILAQGATT